MSHMFRYPDDSEDSHLIFWLVVSISVLFTLYRSFVLISDKNRSEILNKSYVNSCKQQGT